MGVGAQWGGGGCFVKVMHHMHVPPYKNNYV